MRDQRREPDRFCSLFRSVVGNGFLRFGILPSYADIRITHPRSTTSSELLVKPTPSSPSIPARPDYGAIVAGIISYVVNPLVLPPLLFALALAHVRAPWGDVAQGTGVGVVFFTLLPLAYVLVLRMRGTIHSLEVRTRGHRFGPLAVGLMAGLLALAVVRLSSITGRSLLMALILCHVLNTALIAAITLRWKISIHCIALAGVASSLLFVRLHVDGGLLAGPGIGRALVVSALALVPVLAWARVRSNAHTVPQVTGGSLFGLVLPYAELHLLSELALF